jgi:hypothetical protein
VRPQEFLGAAETYLERLKAERMTGKVTFSLDLREGGIGHVGVVIDHELRAPAPAPKEPEQAKG